MSRALSTMFGNSSGGRLSWASSTVVLLPAGGRDSGVSATNPLADVRDGVLHVWGDVPLRATLLVIAALNLFALGAVEVGLPALAYQRFGQGAVALGSTFAAWALGSTLGRFGWVMVGMVALLGAGIAATGVAPTLPVLLVVMLVVGVVEGAGTTYLISWMQRRTGPGM